MRGCFFYIGCADRMKKKPTDVQQTSRTLSVQHRLAYAPLSEDRRTKRPARDVGFREAVKRGSRQSRGGVSDNRVCFSLFFRNAPPYGRRDVFGRRSSSVSTGHPVGCCELCPLPPRVCAAASRPSPPPPRARPCQRPSRRDKHTAETVVQRANSPVRPLPGKCLRTGSQRPTRNEGGGNRSPPSPKTVHSRNRQSGIG